MKPTSLYRMYAADGALLYREWVSPGCLAAQHSQFDYAPGRGAVTSGSDHGSLAAKYGAAPHVSRTENGVITGKQKDFPGQAASATPGITGVMHPIGACIGEKSRVGLVADRNAGAPPPTVLQRHCPWCSSVVPDGLPLCPYCQKRLGGDAV